MEKPEISLTEDEWNKLSIAGIESQTLDNHNFNDIKAALQPSETREKQLRSMFFGESISSTIPSPVYDNLQKLSPNPTYVMNEIFTNAVGKSIGMTSAANVILKGMDQFMVKPAWQTLLEQTNGIHELAKPLGVIANANALINQLTVTNELAKPFGVMNAANTLINQSFGVNELVKSSSAITAANAFINSSIEINNLSKPFGVMNAANTFINQSTGINELVKPFTAMTAANAFINSSIEINDLAKPFGLINAATFINPSTGMSGASHIAESVRVHPYLTSGSSVGIAYLSKIDDQVNQFVNPQRTIASLVNSINPYDHNLAYTTGITKVAGSLLDVSRYKDLGISAITQNFRANHLEFGYASGVVDTMRAATAFTRMGEENLARFDWATVGGRYDLSKALVSSAQTSFLNFTSGYRDVIGSVSAKPNWLYEAPTVAQLPAQEYYTSSQILRLVSDDSVTIEEVSQETKLLTGEQNDYLLEYLPRLDSDLPMMWHGAVQALRSDNPDKIRHFITSLRELFTHVLHILAPDDAFSRWDTASAYYHNSRPTREGRLLFICRNMEGSDAAFAKFMKNDVDSAISLIKMFQSGTHKIKSDYSPQELELIMLRAELSLRTFLKVEFDINRK